MNIRLSRVAVLAAALISFGAMADSQTMMVTTTITGACKVLAIPAMVFTLDPAVGTVQTKTSTVQYHCTKGVSPGTFTVNGVSGGTSSIALAGAIAANTDSIPVDLSWTAATAGTGFSGAANSFDITGTVAAGSYDVSPDTYSKSVTIVIAP